MKQTCSKYEDILVDNSSCGIIEIVVGYSYLRMLERLMTMEIIIMIIIITKIIRIIKNYKNKDNNNDYNHNFCGNDCIYYHKEMTLMIEGTIKQSFHTSSVIL